VSGASDGLLILWSADHVNDSRELVPKLSLKVILPPACLFRIELQCFEEGMREPKLKFMFFLVEKNILYELPITLHEII
jgi:hypothetical protein